MDEKQKLTAALMKAFLQGKTLQEPILEGQESTEIPGGEEQSLKELEAAVNQRAQETALQYPVENRGAAYPLVDTGDVVAGAFNRDVRASDETKVGPAPGPMPITHLQDYLKQAEQGVELLKQTETGAGLLKVTGPMVNRSLGNVPESVTGDYISPSLLERFAYQLKMPRPMTLAEFTGKLFAMAQRIEYLEQQIAINESREMDQALEIRNEMAAKGSATRSFFVTIQVPPDFVGGLARLAEAQRMTPTEFLRRQVERLFQQGRIC